MINVHIARFTLVTANFFSDFPSLVKSISKVLLCLENNQFWLELELAGIGTKDPAGTKTI